MKNGIVKSSGGYILFALLIIGVLVCTIAVVTFSSMRNSLKSAGTKRTNSCAFNIAEAGKEHGLAQLRAKLASPAPNTLTEILQNVSFGKETCMGTYSVRCSSNAALNKVWLRSLGIAGNQSVTIQVTCQRYSLLEKMSFVPKAAISARAEVQTTGNIIIDGRDWDSAGAGIEGGGVYGVSTCRSFTTDMGGSSIGGNGNPPPGPPDKGAAPGAVQQFADSTSYPRTPEEVLGVAPGFLDPYIVNTLPAFPFHGIVYLNTAASISFNSTDLAGSSGILIVHDSSNHSGTGTGTMDGVHGDFKGIIIADRINQLNSNGVLYGAIVALSQITLKDVFGNGNPDVRYSSEVLKNLINYVDKNSLKYYIDVISWKEL